MKRQSLRASFSCAFSGIFELLETERNFRIDVFFAFFAVFMCALTRTHGTNLALIIVCIFVVLGLEGLNSSLEHAVDLACPQQHEVARIAKDRAAGAVLIAALGSVVVGLVVFVPTLLALLSNETRIFHDQMAPLALSSAALVVYCAWVCVHPLPEKS